MARPSKDKLSQNRDAHHTAAARSVSRVMEVLVLLAGAGQPMATMTIARRCEIPRSSAYRLLNVLAHGGFVQAVERDGTWALGPRVGDLAATPTIADAVAILAAFHGSSRHLELGEFAREAKLSVARAEETLAALSAEGLVVADGERYRLGVRMATLAAGRKLLDDVRIVVRPHLIALRDRTGETANLLVRGDLDALYIDQVESHHALRHAGSVGRLVSLTGTAAGEALVQGPGAAPQVVADAVQTGVTAVACAIDASIAQELAIGVSGPTARLRSTSLRDARRAVARAAAAAGRSLDRRPTPA